jgi:hypothetical protein
MKKIKAVLLVAPLAVIRLIIRKESFEGTGQTIPYIIIVIAPAVAVGSLLSKKASTE